MSFVFITVYFNTEIVESETWNTLLQTVPTQERGQVFLVDNSTELHCKEANRQFAMQEKCVYLDMEGNRGLPAAYNRAIEHWLQTDLPKENTWLITADQDTQFPENYLTVLRQETETTDAVLLAPQVKTGKTRLSPCVQKGARFHAWLPEEEGEEGRQRLYYVNSGLCLRGALFWEQGLRYNEELFLDFADFDMENKIYAHSPARTRTLSKLILEQQFSGMEKKRSAQQDLERYRQYVRDGEVFYQTWGPQGPAGTLALRARGLKLAWHHRDLRFLKKP